MLRSMRIGSSACRFAPLARLVKNLLAASVSMCANVHQSEANMLLVSMSPDWLRNARDAASTSASCGVWSMNEIISPRVGFKSF